ncbi:hypothetical protein [Candidatus Uabimicrobium amorphum]|uniref:Uncharacterized protein n=1 Tax=Uabimicrobium amorphum TaxID=2596890 RepID=A0A5S9ITI7_UABAM|nr:hypothetical protein [Candidatus Uabimicrobium amorphum]BBM87280.1 hypothetical protein UABAM_05683 [Candidatus Uabimicrobium amorphum]
MIKSILDFQWAHALSLSTAKLLFMLFFLFIIVFAWSFKRDYVYKGAPDQKLWRDLRIWVIVVMSIPMGLYWYF